MPIPKEIKVGSHIYTVIRLSGKEMGDDLGLCDFNENGIAIRKRLNLNKCQEILLHEILHTCTYPSLVSKTVDDETFVDTVAPLLLQVIKDNPELIKFLTQE